MKLLYGAGTCALGIHALLEEIGKPYEAQAVNLMQGEQHKPEYVAINPKSKVPALVRDDGHVVTEFGAIAYYLAQSNPEKKLFPADLDAQVKVLEILDYATSAVHMQGFTRIFRPGNFNPNEAEHDAVKAAGMAIAEKGLALIDKEMGSQEFVAGDLSIADFAVFYIEFWYAFRMKKALPANLTRHWATMSTRASCVAAMKAEGFA